MGVYNIHLGMGRKDQGWRWLIVRMVMVMMMMMMMAGICSGDETPKEAEDCIVYHIDENTRSPSVRFTENVTVQFLPEGVSDVLTGIKFLLETEADNVTLEFPELRSSQPSCYQNGSPKGKGSKLSDSFETVKAFQWVPVVLSLSSEGSISMGSTSNVCPRVSLVCGTPSLSIEKTGSRSTNVVFNCQDGCPTYSFSTLEKYKHKNKLKGKIYAKRTESDSSSSLQVVKCQEKDGETCGEIQGSNATFPKNANTWEKAELRTFQHKDMMSERYEVLMLNENVVWEDMITDSNCKKTCFRLDMPEDVIIGVGCQPKGTASDGIVQCSCSYPSLDIDNAISNFSKELKHSEILWQCLFIVSLLVFISALLISLTVMKKMSTKVKEILALVQTAAVNVVLLLDLASKTSQGSAPPTQTIISESRQIHSRPPAPLPLSHFPLIPSRTTEQPVNQEPVNNDSSELTTRPKEPVPVQASTHASPVDGLTQTSTHASHVDDLTNTLSQKVDESEHTYDHIDYSYLVDQRNKDNMDNVEEIKERKNVADNGQELSCPESVNSLRHQVKKKKKG